VSRAPARLRSAYRHWTPITTRWHDNDIYGHVNNTVYYGWFDTAVNAWLAEVGLLDIHGSGPIGLVVETGCRFISPLAFPQPIEVGLSMAALGTSSVTYHLGIFAVDGVVAAAEGHFVHVYVDRETRRPVPVSAENLRLLQRLQVKQGAS
jgi:acyl-CoA thioester hydrolase